MKTHFRHAYRELSLGGARKHPKDIFKIHQELEKVGVFQMKLSADDTSISCFPHLIRSNLREDRYTLALGLRLWSAVAWKAGQ